MHADSDGKATSPWDKERWKKPLSTKATALWSLNLVGVRMFSSLIHS